jgi:hypothetical protein
MGGMTGHAAGRISSGGVVLGMNGLGPIVLFRLVTRAALIRDGIRVVGIAAGMLDVTAGA